MLAGRYAEFTPQRLNFTSRLRRSALDPSFEQSECIFMKAMVAAMALRIGESEVARWYGKVGDALDYLIPIVLFAVIVASLGAIAFGFVQ